jgi:hypothetical protein
MVLKCPDRPGLIFQDFVYTINISPAAILSATIFFKQKQEEPCLTISLIGLLVVNKTPIKL